MPEAGKREPAPILEEIRMLWQEDGQRQETIKELFAWIRRLETEVRGSTDEEDHPTPDRPITSRAPRGD